MAAITTAVVSTGAGLVGAKKKADAAKDAARGQQRALDAQQNAFQPFSLSGPGGLNARVGKEDGSIDLGDLGIPQAQLMGLAQRSLGQARNSQLPRGVAEAGNLVSQLTNRNNLLGGAFDQFRQSQSDLGGLQGNGFQRGLQNQAFGGAQQHLADASMGGEQARSRTLDLLRQQAAPFEERSAVNLADDLFSRGRFGTTGGARNVEAFSRGLGQADLSRQLAANQEGRNFTQNALGQAQGLSGLGSGLRGLEESLVGSAFSRFGQTAGLTQNLSQGNLQNQIQLAGVGRGFQQQDLSMGLQALQGQSGIQQQGLQQFQASLAAAQAGANARVGAGSNMANIVGSPNFNPGGGTSAVGSILGSLGKNLPGAVQDFQGAGGGFGGIAAGLGGLFG